LAWVSTLPAKTIDLATVVAISYTVEVSDSMKGADYICKAPSKTLADSSKGVDAFGRTVSFHIIVSDAGRSADAYGKVASFRRSLADAGKTYDYIKKLPLKCLVDAGRACEYWRKIALKGVGDVGKCVDVLVRVATFIRGFADAGRATDYMCKLPAKAMRDSARSLDYIGLRATFFRSFADAGKAVDALAKASLKVYADVYKGADRISRLSLKRLTDSFKGVDWYSRPAYFVRTLADAGLFADYVSMSVSKSVLDWLVGEHAPVLLKGKEFRESVVAYDYMCKYAGKVHVDVGKASDWYYKLVGKSFHDLCEGVDYVRVTASFIRTFTDAGKLADFIGKAPIKAFADAGKGLDYYSKVLVKVLADASVSTDYLRKEVYKTFEFEVPSVGWVKVAIGKEVKDAVTVSDWLIKSLIKRLIEYVVVRDAPYRLITLTLRDSFAGDFLAPKEVIIPRKDVTLTSEYVRKDVGKKAVETVGISEAVIKYVVKRFVESAHVTELVSKLSGKVLEDVAKTVDVVAKVGFKLAGYDVRRVYFLPKEFQPLWDIIESGDHNTKVEVCKALVEAFKRVRDKLGE
jgi:hypothetical protein